jgi:hypothetical protein
MPTNTDTRRRSRRAFIATAGTALSAPIAAAAATLPTTTAVDLNDLNDPTTRLERLEAIEAIRDLNQAYARYVKAGERDAAAALFDDPAAATLDAAVRGITIDSAAEADAIELAPDGQAATARLHRVVDAVHEIGPSCPLVEMAREQGGGVVARTERGFFETAYVRRAGAWKIQHATFQAAGPD